MFIIMKLLHYYKKKWSMKWHYILVQVYSNLHFVHIFLAFLSLIEIHLNKLAKMKQQAIIYFIVIALIYTPLTLIANRIKGMNKSHKKFQTEGVLCILSKQASFSVPCPRFLLYQTAALQTVAYEIDVPGAVGSFWRGGRCTSDWSTC